LCCCLLGKAGVALSYEFPLKGEVLDRRLGGQRCRPSNDLSGYVQVKSSEKPASKDHVTISGAPWTEGELYHGAPIFNKHDRWKAGMVIILDRVSPERTDYYIAPPDALERLVRPLAELHAAKPKKDGQPRSIAFRKELPRAMLKQWKDAWHLITGEIAPKGA
jgi:hypothetical protein